MAAIHAKRQTIMERDVCFVRDFINIVAPDSLLAVKPVDYKETHAQKVMRRAAKNGVYHNMVGKAPRKTIQASGSTN